MERLADRKPAVLHTRTMPTAPPLDEVEYDPGLPRADAGPITHGLHAAPVGRRPARDHVVRAGPRCRLELRAGHVCPISMTYAVVRRCYSTPDAGGGLRAVADQP